MSRRMFAAFALIWAMAGFSAAQTTGTHVRVQRLQGYGSAHRVTEALEKIITRLDPDRLAPVIAGSWEEQVLSAGKKSAERTLRISLGDLGVGYYTVSTEEGDVLAARWNGADSGRPEKAIWLWDTPEYTTFVMETSPSLLRGEDFTRYCEGLLVWDKDPIHFKSLQLAYLEPEDDKHWVVGAVEHTKTERGSYQVSFVAMYGKESAYVALGLSKPILWSEYPPEAYQVRERFPPLRLRLANTARQALFEELGKGYIAPNILTYPTNRDAVVVRELLSRGPLSEAELRQVVVGGFGNGDNLSALVVNSKVIAFLQAVQTDSELAACAPALGSIFIEVPIQRGLQDAVLGHVFRGMMDHHVDFSGAALAFVERDQFVSSSLFYLEKAIRDGEMLRRLAEIKVRPELEAQKKLVLENVRRRLAANPSSAPGSRPPL